jgi:hypothetical protein
MIVHREIPGTIQKLRIAPSSHELAVPVDDLKCTLADRGDGAVRRRYVAHDDEAVARHAESRAEPSNRTGEEHIGGSRRGERCTRSQLYDGGAGALEIGTVVEIADQHIAGGDGAAVREILPVVRLWSTVGARARAIGCMPADI